MRISVTTQSDDIFNLDVSEDLELENFKAFCEVESAIPASDIVLIHQGKILDDGAKNLKHYGLKEGDVVLIQRKSSAPARNQGFISTILTKWNILKFESLSILDK